MTHDIDTLAGITRHLQHALAEGDEGLAQHFLARLEALAAADEIRNDNGRHERQEGRDNMQTMTESRYREGLNHWLTSAQEALAAGDIDGAKQQAHRADKWRRDFGDADRHVNRPPRTGYRNTATHEAR